MLGKFMVNVLPTTSTMLQGLFMLLLAIPVSTQTHGTSLPSI